MSERLKRAQDRVGEWVSTWFVWILIAIVVVAFVVTPAYLIIAGDTDAPADSPDRFKGGTAPQWQEQSERWHEIAFKFKGVAAKYRELNDELLEELGQ